jgi:hypothetical protein
VDLTFGRNTSAGNAPIPTNGDNFAFRVTSDNNGLYFLAQTFNANNLTYTAINWGLAGNNAAWRYRLVDSNQCAAPQPTDPPMCFQKGNDSAVGSPSGLTTLSLADASIQLAATYDSTTNTSTQEVFVPWSTILDGEEQRKEQGSCLGWAVLLRCARMRALCCCCFRTNTKITTDTLFAVTCLAACPPGCLPACLALLCPRGPAPSNTGQNGWDPSASTLNLTFAGSWLRDCPNILLPVNSCNGRWGEPGVGGTYCPAIGDFLKGLLRTPH